MIVHDYDLMTKKDAIKEASYSYEGENQVLVQAIAVIKPQREKSTIGLPEIEA